MILASMRSRGLDYLDLKFTHVEANSDCGPEINWNRIAGNYLERKMRLESLERGMEIWGKWDRMDLDKIFILNSITSIYTLII